MWSRILGSNLFRVFSGLLATLSLLFCASGAQGTQYYWNSPTGGSGTWDTTSTKWSVDSTTLPSVVWNNANGDDAILDGTYSSSATVTVAAGGISVHNLTIETPIRNKYDLTGSTITFVGSSPVLNIDTSSGSNGASIHSVIAGTSGLVKTGGGFLDLWGANTYSGGTDIQSGPVDPQTDTAFGISSSPVTVESGATIWSWDGVTRTLSNAITINGTGNGSGALQEQSGTFNLNGPLALGSDAQVHVVGGSNTMNITNTVTGTSANFTVTSDGGANINISGNMNLGTGRLIVNSNGTVTLTGTANSWSGGTTLSANGSGGGVLNIGTGGAASIGTSGTITLTISGTNYPTLNFNTSSSLTLNNYITGSGNIQLASTNTGTITLTGSSDYSHNTTISGGKLMISNTSALGTSAVSIGSALPSYNLAEE